MCGRYTLTTPADVLARLFELGQAPALVPRFNAAPTQMMPVVRHDRDGARVMTMHHWGLIPFWAKDRSIGNRMINARSESVQQRAAFREAIGQRRCLVPADGFFEWKKGEGKRPKQPWLIRRADGSPMALAGLWSRWKDTDGTRLDSFTILTTGPNAFMADLHDRMPVILEPECWAGWLDRERTADAVLPWLTPAADGVLEAYAVSRRVNKPEHDDAEVIARVAEETGPITDDDSGTLFDGLG